MKNKLSFLFISLLALCLGACAKTQPSSSVTANEVVNLEIYAFNDFHGNVMDSDTGIGLSRTTSLLKSRSTQNNTIFISQGDMWQGSAESNITRGALVTDWMNQNNFVSMSLGNHEFDWGEDPIKENVKNANFPFLAINVYNHATNQPVTYCQPSVVVEKNGAKIGIIGAIGDCYSSISASRVRDIYFKVGDELTALVKKEAKKLKEAGCDMVIYAIHDDDSAYDVSLSDGFVDLVLEGHTHQNYVRTDSKGVYHIQGGGYNKTIPYINLDINTKTDKITVNQAKALRTNDYNRLMKDEETEKLFTKYDSLIGQVREPLGTNAVRRDSAYLRQLVANLYLMKGEEKWGASYNLFLGGGYVSCRSPYYLPKGEVSYADIYNLFPFDNDLVLCSISGYYLSKQFVLTENENYFVSYTNYGEANKNSIDNNTTYYIIADTYSSDYAPNHLSVIAKYSEEGYYARDMLKEYLIAGGFN